MPARVESLSAYLEAQRARAAAQSPTAAASTRERVRARCRAEGAPVPDWASARSPARNPAGRGASIGAFGRRKAGPNPAPVVRTIEIPPALSAWRAQGYGRVVQINTAGATLYEHGSAPRKFPSVEAAIAAV